MENNRSSHICSFHVIKNKSSFWRWIYWNELRTGNIWKYFSHPITCKRIQSIFQFHLHAKVCRMSSILNRINKILLNRLNACQQQIWLQFLVIQEIQAIKLISSILQMYFIWLHKLNVIIYWLQPNTGRVVVKFRKEKKFMVRNR